MRSSLTGGSRKGWGAPAASGWKKRRGSFMDISTRASWTVKPEVVGTGSPSAAHL
jgi:hypothetical protein